MTPETISTPPASTPLSEQQSGAVRLPFGGSVVDTQARDAITEIVRAKETTGPARPWFLYFTAITRRLGVLVDAVMGWASLTHQGAIPKVSEAGTLEESAITDNGTTILALLRNLGLNASAVQTLAGRTYIVIKGTTLAGALELQTAQADADGNVVGLTQFTDINSTAADKRVASVVGFLDGATANNRGGRILFLLKSDGVSGLVEKARLDVNGFDVPAAYRVAGTKVVGAQQADPGAAAGSPVISTSITLQTADGVYSANEQTMLNDHKASILALNTAVFALKAEVDHLITDRDRLRAVLQAHGLMA